MLLSNIESLLCRILLLLHNFVSDFPCYCVVLCVFLLSSFCLPPVGLPSVIGLQAVYSAGEWRIAGCAALGVRDAGAATSCRPCTASAGAGTGECHAVHAMLYMPCCT